MISTNLTEHLGTRRRRRVGDGNSRPAEAERGIEPGDLVEVANDRGAFRCRAAVHPDARPGVAWSYKVHWGGNANATTAVRDADMGGSPTFHDNRVDVAHVAWDAPAADRRAAEPVGD